MHNEFRDTPKTGDDFNLGLWVSLAAASVIGAGQGLLKVGSSLVPFINKFPRNTELYKLMTTKFGEV